MSRVLNHRNAVLGWAAWRLVKRRVSRRLGQPRGVSQSRVLAALLVASAAALGLGFLAVFRGSRVCGASTEDPCI